MVLCRVLASGPITVLAAASPISGRHASGPRGGRKEGPQGGSARRVRKEGPQGGKGSVTPPFASRRRGTAISLIFTERSLPAADLETTRNETRVRR